MRRVIFIPGLMAGMLADKLRETLDLGKEFWPLLLEPKSNSLRVGGGLMAAGTLMILIYIIVRAIQNVV